ncbi:hypothetical protein ERJ75_000386300 [Trypanosoma vivax]|nr:hypothetical protein ERJ75_000386300 [Trypanosoma vivax]
MLLQPFYIWRHTSSAPYVATNVLLRPGFDPTKQMYQLECAFEEPTFRFICEGVDMDYRQEVREAVLSAIGRGSSNFTGKNEDDFVCAGSLQNTLRLLRATAKRQLISFAQVKSTPRLFHIMFETIATCNTALSLIAADHFTFAAMVATNGTKEVQAAILDDVDSCRIIGAIAHRELVAEGAPLNTEAVMTRRTSVLFYEGQVSLLL